MDARARLHRAFPLYRLRSRQNCTSKSYAIIGEFWKENGNVKASIDCIIQQFMRLKADLTLLLVSIIWGSAFVAQRVAGQLGSVYLFNGARYLLAAIVVVPFAIRSLRNSNSSHALTREQYKWMFIVGSVLFGGSAVQQVGLL